MAPCLLKHTNLSTLIYLVVFNCRFRCLIFASYVPVTCVRSLSGTEGLTPLCTESDLSSHDLTNAIGEQGSTEVILASLRVDAPCNYQGASQHRIDMLPTHIVLNMCAYSVCTYLTGRVILIITCPFAVSIVGNIYESSNKQRIPYTTHETLETQTNPRHLNTLVSSYT